jgi:hypothetical protein
MPATVPATAVVAASCESASAMKPTTAVTATLCNKRLGSDDEGDKENC